MSHHHLSALQQTILIRVYEQHLEYARDNFLEWARGVDWRSRCTTRSAQAAHARALRRLETAGLIRRLGWIHEETKRHTHVQIRASGIRIAEQLTHTQGVWMLTVGTMTVPELKRMTVEEFSEAIAQLRAGR